MLIDPTDQGQSLAVHTLGRCEILLGGRKREVIALRKARALLIYMLLNPGPHDRGRLAGLLWGGCSEKKARHNLRQTLWRLRRSLPPDLLIEDRLTVGVREASRVQVDARLFEAEIEEADPASLLVQSTCFSCVISLGGDINSVHQVWLI